MIRGRNYRGERQICNWNCEFYGGEITLDAETRNGGTRATLKFEIDFYDIILTSPEAPNNGLGRYLTTLGYEDHAGRGKYQVRECRGGEYEHQHC